MEHQIMNSSRPSPPHVRFTSSTSWSSSHSSTSPFPNLQHSHQQSPKITLFSHAVRLFHANSFTQSLKAHRALLRDVTAPSGNLRSRPSHGLSTPLQTNTDVKPEYIHVNLAILRLHLGEYALAAESLDRALAWDRDLAIVWYLLGMCLFHLGNYRRAEKQYKRCLACVSVTPVIPTDEQRQGGGTGAARNNAEGEQLADYRPLGLRFVLQKVRVEWNIRLCYLWKLHKQMHAERPKNWCLNRLPGGIMFEPVQMLLPPIILPGRRSQSLGNEDQPVAKQGQERLATERVRPRKTSLPSYLSTPKFGAIFPFQRRTSPHQGSSQASPPRAPTKPHTSSPLARPAHTPLVSIDEEVMFHERAGVRVPTLLSLVRAHAASSINPLATNERSSPHAHLQSARPCHERLLGQSQPRSAPETRFQNSSPNAKPASATGIHPRMENFREVLDQEEELAPPRPLSPSSFPNPGQRHVRQQTIGKASGIGVGREMPLPPAPRLAFEEHGTYPVVIPAPSGQPTRQLDTQQLNVHESSSYMPEPEEYYFTLKAYNSSQRADDGRLTQQLREVEERDSFAIFALGGTFQLPPNNTGTKGKGKGKSD